MNSRETEPGDSGFLEHLFATTRPHLPAELVTFQHRLREDAFRASFRGDDRVLLADDGLPVGRIVVSTAAEEIRVVDLAVLPDHQGGGVARSALSDVMAAACAEGKTVRLTVDETNDRALALYQGLGFVPTRRRPPDVELEWRPTITRSMSAT